METFADFKNSFSYGKRNNLNFKFFSQMTDDEAADFIEELLTLVGAALNDANIERILEHVIKGQKNVYSKPAKITYQEGHFSYFKKKIAESKIGLLTSTGHFVQGDDPAPFGICNMTQQEAIGRIKDFIKEKPILSMIPKDTLVSSLRVRHGGYDITGAQVDHDSAFPLESLTVLERQGIIGQLAESTYSFVGACAQGALKKQTEQIWVNLLKKQKLDAILLIPG
jgi:hypothetical protein